MISNHNKTPLNLAKKLVIYQLIIVMLAGFLVPASDLKAADPLTITDIFIVKSDRSATISWETNQSAYGRLEYGLSSNNYHWYIQTGQKKSSHAVTIFGLNPDTDYYFQITADNDTSEVTSFEQTFETKKDDDNKAPAISDVRVAYVTGSTATIQWLTDEAATSVIEYGRTESYGSTRSNNSKVRVHDLTITGLTGNAQYHFRVKSTDDDNNTSRWHDMTFRILPSTQVDQADLTIHDIKPTSANDVNVTETTAVISWRTNKLAQGWIRYGTSTSYGKTKATNPPRDFFQEVTLTGLKPGTSYYFDIQAKDVLGKQIRSAGYSFTTKSGATGGSNTGNYPGQILGAASCDVNLQTDFGHYGIYYNLTQDHPETELWHGQEVPNHKIARANDWYNLEYFSFTRVDQKLDFGKKFFPINEGKFGDPFHFAVNWRSIIDVPQDGYYKYKIGSDDDSWVFIDDQLTTNLGGVHPAKYDERSVFLSAGYHKLEIYFAERSRGSSYFSFIADSNLKFHPLPDGCSIQDVLDYASDGYPFTGFPYNNQGGVVLGVSNIDNTNTAYACNPNLGYTKIKSLYKTANSPDIWAILETGQKHYITSPSAFNKYQCDWSAIRTVSQTTLDSYANANLVRTIDDPVIYHLFQRPDHKWLKINIPSPTVFVSYSDNYWGNVARVDVLDVQAYPQAQLITAEDDSNIYLIEGNRKRQFKSTEIFNQSGYDFAEVVELNQIHLDSFENGSVID